MKNFKKLTAVLALVLISTFSFAQKIGVRAGAGLASTSLNYDGESEGLDLKSRVAFHLGVIGEFSFTKMLAVETGLMISQKGYRLSTSNDYGDFKGSANIIYGEVPLKVKAYYTLDDDLKVFGTFGPYVGVAAMGSSKYSYKDDDGQTEKSSDKFVFGNDEDSDLKRLDYGLGIGAGVAKGKLQLGINYNFGLANLAPSSEDKSSWSNRVFDFSLTYFLK